MHIFRMTLACLALSLVVLVVSCGGRADVADEDMGAPVPNLVILSSLPEANRVNYEMAQELAEELAKIGVTLEARPTDFSVLLDVLYGEDMDYDAYTIGWSGRVERLDPDMFIHSINHSDNAVAGANNTSRFSNAEFDILADAQRQEMDVEARREIVWRAQRILAEEVPRITLYSRANVQTYDKTRFTNMVNMSGEGLFNEWSPLVMEPLSSNHTVPVVASNINITNLNPFAARSVYDWRNLRLIYDKLVRLSPQVEPEPWAATGWEIVEDTVVDVTIREGMTFHDGKPVTVDDVVWSYQTWMDLPDSYFASFTNPIESVEARDGQTVRFVLKAPYAPFITTTLTQIPIVPRHIWENVGDVTQYENARPVGSGPFKFVRFRPGEELVTERFDDYFFPVNIEGYIFKIYASPEGVLSDLELKNVDVISYDLIPAHINQIKNNEGGRFSHLELTEAPDIGFFYIGLNNNRPPFNNADFRRALTYLVDYDYALDVLLEGYGSRGGGGLVINAANEFWHNPEVPIYDTYDPEKARELLAEAGFTWDSNGRLRMPR
ncbi:ABC transporter substrate-binding protein [Alkalispirochaeta sphaeroplastigenens]|uniref:ABC transporter substrate-binding protein n=2 Tax=Alkalispirochaeta sphaeroplastigenens TaxID=1187066 RepID=A0A2S4JSV5_9SPIO|nr:ABC transporter substrate-binding protein [Alkalispirochaeta sphaeroplastigenens]